MFVMLALWLIFISMAQASTNITMNHIAPITVSNVYEASFHWCNSTNEEDEEESEIGVAITFSADNNSIAMGTWHDIGDRHRSGQVRVYNFKDEGWDLVHGQIDFVGAVDDERLDYKVSLSDDGNILTIGYPSLKWRENFSGNLYVFKNDGKSWEQLLGYIIRQEDSTCFINLR